MTRWKRFLHQTSVFMLTTIGKAIAHLILRTCRWKIEGLEQFYTIAEQNKCILMLWHNRLALAPFFLTRFAPDFIYTAFISNSRDGEFISQLVESYSIGRTIRVPHNARHEALRQFIRVVNEGKEIPIITPDGPRGPCYQMKPGLPLAALATGAMIIPFNWTASRFWQLKTWDGLQFPKPFSRISVVLGAPTCFANSPLLKMEQAKELLETALNATSHY